MDKIRELQQEENFLLRKAREVASQTDEKGKLSDEQIAEIDELKQKAAAVRKDWEGIKRAIEIQRELAGSQQSSDDEPQRRMPASMEVAIEKKQARAFANDGFSDLEITRQPPSRIRAFSGPKGAERAHKAGLWIQQYTGERNPRLADTRAVKLARRHIRDYHPEMLQENIEERALGTTPNTAGGALVPIELQAAIVELREASG